MKEIEGLDLNSLVLETSKEILEERRKQAAGIIKKQLQRIEQLVSDIKETEKQLKNKQDKLAKAQEKLDKVKNGDWAVLSELEKLKDPSKDNKDSKYGPMQSIRENDEKDSESKEE